MLIRSWFLSALLVGACFSTARGAGEKADLLAGAGARIEQHRKTDVLITVVDSAGQPVAETDVKVQQTRHAFLFGCNIFLWGHAGKAEEESAYRKHFAELFNFATLPFYWGSYESQQNQPRHKETRQVATWCRERGIVAKGHPLAWNYADPRWLPNDFGQIRRLQMARIDDCVSRFRGLTDRWDVVNEATHFDRDSFKKQAPKMTGMWAEAGQVEFVLECFEHARKANPQATLLINDYRVDPAYEALLKKLVDNDGKRIFDVIGIQSHMHGGVWTNQKIWDVCERFAKFGVPLHFTEMTVLSGKRGWNLDRKRRDWPSTEEGEQQQADEVERIYTMIFSHPSTEALTWWDFSDRGAWQGAPAGFLGKDLTPKPAYDRLHGLIKEKWWTQLTAKTDRQGQMRFRGFYGDYEVTVVSANKKQVLPVTVIKGDGNKFELRLP